MKAYKVVENRDGVRISALQYFFRLEYPVGKKVAGEVGRPLVFLREAQALKFARYVAGYVSTIEVWEVTCHNLYRETQLPAYNDRNWIPHFWEYRLAETEDPYKWLVAPEGTYSTEWVRLDRLVETFN